MPTATLSDVLAAIDAAPQGRSTGAFFDTDGAIVAGAVDAAAIGGWRDKDEAEVEKLAGRAFAKSLAQRIHPEARELLAAHRRRGHTVVLTSSATRHQVRPLADALDVDDVVCAEAEVTGGRLTGQLVGPACAGDAKAAAVERYARRHKIDLSRSHAYASGGADAPILTPVGNPHPVNPDKGLARAAERQGWSVLRFDSRGRPGLETVVRSMAAYGMMVPSMLGGVAVRFLNGDPHAITEFGVGNWVERMFAVTGVTLNVQGEENLWSHRPAVFVYNHRNNFDPYVAIRLVRRGWGSVAKREIAGPLTGVMQWLTPNVAFIDRRDAAKAIEGLRPVTELLGRGVSVLVAPEGTRSVTGQLGRFKKGAFRMAMEAGVPIVPIVIRNADRVTTREATIIRKGTIDVAVLPPVSVEGWTLDDLDARMGEVRQLFVDTLAEWPGAGRARPARAAAAARKETGKVSTRRV
jgi:putative phosphoserine phosphatase/1-acylglycerol-3-phosphate O-acyltransferase